MAIRTKLRAMGRILGPVLILAVLSPGLSAADLDQAKQRGVVCELPNGFLQAAGSATADVSAMVKNINDKRKQEYARIASEHGVTPEAVGKLTAQKLTPKCQ